MINQIPMGKTTHGVKQHGRATRHKDVRMSAMGSWAFYLQCRIFRTGEFAEMSVDDWSDNEKWFDIKLLADIIGSAAEEMTSDSYLYRQKVMLKALNLPSGDLLHLGRDLGSKTLDLSEEETKEILWMGQWSSGAWDNSYSSKHLLAPIQKLAGFVGSKMYFNTRTSIEPPPDLLQLTPCIGRWCHSALDAVSEVVSNNGKHQMACQFLSGRQHSCHRHVVFRVKVHTDRHELTAQEAIEQLEDKWVQCRCSASNFVTCFQSIGAIEKRRPEENSNHSLDKVNLSS